MLMWVHEISQSALAVAVATLGLVILLELRSIARLRRAVDEHLARLFEQLDLLRFESQQIMEAQERVPATVASPAAQAPTPPAPANAGYGAPAPLGAGEARLLAALTAARTRARLGRSEAGNTR